MKIVFLIQTLLIHTLVYSQSMDDKIKILANEIAEQVVKNGSKKVAVTTLDYKGCSTEFGKFLAEELTGNLSVSGRAITVVNQKLLEALLVQNKLTAQGLLEAKNDAAKLGQVSGIDALVYGTITTLGEDIRISISIVKLPTLAVFGYAKSSFSLTNGLKEMLPCIESGADDRITEKPVSESQDLSNTLMGDKSVDMKKESCTDNTYYYGQVCLENMTKQPLVLYKMTGHGGYKPNIPIGVNARNCGPTVIIARKSDTQRSVSFTFYFHTGEEDEGKRRYGQMNVDMEACKVKVRVINPQRLFLSKTKL
ncbi:MAG: CsgG/HfaB family protein [Spirosomataceae bacterium]